MAGTQAILATCDSHQQAEGAIRRVAHAGFSMKQLSIVGKGYHSEEYPLGFYTLIDRTRDWGLLGLSWGALWGLLLGAALFWVPGFGLPGVVDFLLHTLAGCVIGAGAGAVSSILGAVMVSVAMSKDSIVKYRSSQGADTFLLLVHGADADVERARQLLERTAVMETDGCTA